MRLEGLSANRSNENYKIRHRIPKDNESNSFTVWVYVSLLTVCSLGVLRIRCGFGLS